MVALDESRPGRVLISAGFFASAELDPAREVLVEPSGARVAAGDLLAGMNRAARGLRKLGVIAGETIAVVLSNRGEFIECYGAAIQSGLLFVAVNWHLGASKISYILEDSNAKVVVTESRFALSTTLVPRVRSTCLRGG